MKSSFSENNNRKSCRKIFPGSQQDNDTIAALCTAPGGALAIIRISGPEALSAASKVWRGRQPLSAETARIMHLGKACPQADGASGEPLLAVYMKGAAELHRRGHR